MGVTNKSLASHLQLKVQPFYLEVQKGTGDTGVLAPITFPCKLDAIHIATFAITDSPFLSLNIARWLGPAGFTSIPINSTFTIPAFSTSGCLQNGVSLGSSPIYLQPSDLVCYAVGGGAQGRYDNLFGCVALRPTQDNIVYFNNINGG